MFDSQPLTERSKFLVKCLKDCGLAILETRRLREDQREAFKLLCL